MKMIDVHCHLYPPYFNDAAELKACLERARHGNAPVEAIIVVSESIQDLSSMMALKERYEDPNWIHLCAGLHPVQRLLEHEGGCAAQKLTRDLPRMLDWIRAHHQHLVGVGEVGLDYRRGYLQQQSSELGVSEDELKRQQRDVFRQQIELASELRLPLNVHSRCAGHYAISELVQAQARNVVLHAFDGRPKYAEEAVLRHGYFFSVPPSIVRSESMRSLVARLPLSHLLLESDAPALGPLRNQPNEPANIRIACQAIADIHGCTLAHVAETTTANARRLFPKLSDVSNVAQQGCTQDELSRRA